MRAAMRLPGLRSSRLSLQLPRRSRASPASIQDTDVFANSLQKTLEAHRSSNRAGLIRKVYPRAPSAGLFRPEIPPENRASYQPPAPPAPTPARPETKVASKRQTRRRDRETNPRSADDLGGTYAIRDADTSGNAIPEQRPWLKHLGSSQAAGDASTYLDAEIQALGQYLAPTPCEQAHITQLSEGVASLLKRVVPHNPQLVGSRSTGLALAHSSIDFLLPVEDIPRALHRTRKPSATRPQIRDVHMDLLRQVEVTLQSTLEFSGQVNLSGRPSPVLRARHRPTGLLLQFYCGERTPAIIEFLQDYLAEYPSLRPLYMVTRTLLEARGLFGPSQAGIGREALALLLVAFLKMTHGRFPGPHRLGDQFLAFLELYGAGVDLQSVGVATDPPGFFDTKTLRASVDEAAEPAYLRGQRSLINAKRTAAIKGNVPAAQRLCVQDPTHYMNDLGRSCTRTAELQSAFTTARRQLQHEFEKLEGPGRNESILTATLHANFDGLEKLRGRIVSPVDGKVKSC